MPSDIKMLLSYEKQAREVRQLLEEIKPDVVHALFLTSYGYLAARAGYGPLVITALGSDILIFPNESLFKRSMLKYVLKKADRINSISSNIREEYLKYGAQSDRIFDLNFGIDLNLFRSDNSRLQVGRDILRIVSTRNFYEIYNLELLIEALGCVRERNINFECILAGSGPLENKLNSMIKKYNMQNQIQFMGHINNEYLPDILRSADIYVSTSRSEGINISLLEAMACAVFPVVTKIEANEQWICDGENGYLVPLDKPDYLAEKIIEASQNLEFRKSAAQINRQIVESKADLSKNMKIYEGEYKNMGRG